MTDASVESLTRLLGIEDGYYDYLGRHHRISSDTMASILRVMGFSVPPGNDVVTTLEGASWTRLLSPVRVFLDPEPHVLQLNVPAETACSSHQWRLESESGERWSGSFTPDALSLIGARRVEGLEYRRYRLPVPETLPHGYHVFQVGIAGERGTPASCSLIVAPGCCYQPREQEAIAKVWGPAVQLYSLRSSRNWGIGDFSDLRRVVEHCGRCGADIIGLNPLHALYPACPEHASPYSPQSRLFLNVLYIDAEAIPEFPACAAAVELTGSSEFQSRLARLRAAECVDYAGVAEIKFAVLRLLFEHFRTEHLERDTRRAGVYSSFAEQHGEALEMQARFTALDSHFHTRASRPRGWCGWPDEYREANSARVADLAETLARDVEFHKYLQWVADEQLQAVERATRTAGMSLGLYRDLALGVDAGGAETWVNQGLYRSEASIGAPPDALAAGGQSWGIPPADPRILREQAYAPFAELLRANMRSGGALRLDHVMGLLRQWWVPCGASPVDGAYVAYPLRDLLGILALESRRSHCMIIGEDLGTVPDEVREAMADFGVLSYRVLYFEKESNDEYKLPASYPRNALVAANTHDLPTLRGYWCGSDIALRDKLGQFPDRAARERAEAARDQDRRALLSALSTAGLAPTEPQAWLDGNANIWPELSSAILQFLARSDALLMVVQLEDWIGISDPVNVPGTSSEYPNWKRKLPMPLHEIFALPEVSLLCDALTRARQQVRETER